MYAPKQITQTIQTRLNRWANRAGWWAVITLIIGMVSLVIGFWGWSQIEPPLGVGPIASIAYDMAAALQSFVPNPERFKEGNSVTRFAAGVGMATTISAGLLTASVLLAGAANRFWITNFASDHVIILGDTEFSRALSNMLSGTNLVIRAIKADDDLQKLDEDGPIQVPFEPERLFQRLRVADAKAMIIDLGSDAQTLNLAAKLHARLPAFSDKPKLALRVENRVFAEQFFDQWLVDGEAIGVRDRPALLSPAVLVAQKAIGQHPLFAQADALSQSRVHAVILGFGELGEALFDHVFLTSAAGKLTVPKVTILDTKPSAKRAFDARRPNVRSSLDVIFECFDTATDGFDPDNGTSRLCEIAAETPVTAYFVALPSNELNLEAALQLKRLFSRRPKLAAPVFFRSRDDAAVGFLGEVSKVEVWPWERAAATPLCAMTIDGKDIEDALRPDSQHDLLAQKLHLNYVDRYGASGEASNRWPKLRETYRRSNIRAALHMAAKLYTLGVSVNTIRQGALGSFPKLTESETALVQDASPFSDAVLTLAKIEHTRWMIDRKLDGWRYGPVRNNSSLIHPLLVEWDELKKAPDEVEKDRQIVLETLNSLIGGSITKA
jgi:hypothetical protein